MGRQRRTDDGNTWPTAATINAALVERHEAKQAMLTAYGPYLRISGRGRSAPSMILVGPDRLSCLPDAYPALSAQTVKAKFVSDFLVPQEGLNPRPRHYEYRIGAYHGLTATNKNRPFTKVYQCFR